jgi:hypothetical protein
VINFFKNKQTQENLKNNFFKNHFPPNKQDVYKSSKNSIQPKKKNPPTSFVYHIKTYVRYGSFLGLYYKAAMFCAIYIYIYINDASRDSVMIHESVKNNNKIIQI